MNSQGVSKFWYTGTWGGDVEDIEEVQERETGGNLVAGWGFVAQQLLVVRCRVLQFPVKVIAIVIAIAIAVAVAIAIVGNTWHCSCNSGQRQVGLVGLGDRAVALL